MISAAPVYLERGTQDPTGWGGGGGSKMFTSLTKIYDVKTKVGSQQGVRFVPLLTPWISQWLAYINIVLYFFIFCSLHVYLDK